MTAKSKISYKKVAHCAIGMVYGDVPRVADVVKEAEVGESKKSMKCHDDAPEVKSNGATDGLNGVSTGAKVGYGGW